MGQTVFWVYEPVRTHQMLVRQAKQTQLRYRPGGVLYPEYRLGSHLTPIRDPSSSGTLLFGRVTIPRKSGSTN